jgi:tetratricopeptide (TPR) repeat protein
MAGSWIALHRGLALIREGRIAEGEWVFMNAVERYGSGWQLYANLGRIMEGRGDIPAALEFYQRAAAMVRERHQAAIIQMRIRRCLNALGRDAEGRRSLELAHELDPDDINIRREFTWEFRR